MSNIKEVHGPDFWRVPVHGITLNGWSVQYLSGREQDLPGVKPGHWLTQWRLKRISDEEMEAAFAFEPEQVMCFETEAQAKQASEYLRTQKVETRILKVGHPSPEFGEGNKTKLETPSGLEPEPLV